MTERKPSRIVRPPTPDERERHERVRKEIEAERPRIDAEAEAAADRYESSVLRHLRKRGAFDPAGAVAALKAAREEQGLSLTDVSARTGIAEPTLFDLEAGRTPDPTLRTLQRYADAVGRRFNLGPIKPEEGGKADAAAQLTHGVR